MTEQALTWSASGYRKMGGEGDEGEEEKRMLAE